MSLFDKLPISTLLRASGWSFVSRIGKLKIANQRDVKLAKRGGVNGTDAAVETLGDPHAQSCFDRMNEVIASLNMVIEPGDEKSTEASDWIEENYLKPYRSLIMRSLSLAKITGCAAIEHIYVNDNGLVFVDSIEMIDSDRLVYEIKDDGRHALRLAEFTHQIDGIQVPPWKIVDYRYYSVPVPTAYGLGIGSHLIELVEIKKELLNLWLRIAYRFSSPIKIAEVPDDASDEEITGFLEALKNMVDNATFILPQGFKISVQDISSSGADSLLNSLIEYCDSQVSNLILGESITGKELANGSQSRDVVAKNITSQKARSLANDIASTLNSTIIKWLCALNFPNQKPPKVRFEFPEDTMSYLETMKILKELGVKMDPKFLADKYSIPYVANRPALGSSNDTL